MNQARTARRLVRGRARDAVLLPVIAAVCVTPSVLGVILPADAFSHPPPERFDDGFPPLWTAVLPVIGIALLVIRRRYPRTVLAGVVAVAVVAVFATGDPGATAVPVMMALFNLALRTDRKTWLVAAGITAVVLVVPIVIVELGMWPKIFGTVIWVSLPPAVAEAVRNRRAYLAEAVQRAHRAERTKAEEAKRQVAEERIRIARDLHDILAHSIAVVNVQSGVAAHVIDRDVDQARQALVHINDASDAALVELRTMLDVLRQDGDPQAPTRPAPMLGDVDELFVGLRSSGVTVEADVADDLTNVPTEVSIVGYRILQEALTNVLKHATASRVRVSVTTDATNVRLEVVDDGVGSPDPPPTGHGRIGMRERINAVGGSLDDGPVDGGGYRVLAQLPLSSPRSHS